MDTVKTYTYHDYMNVIRQSAYGSHKHGESSVNHTPCDSWDLSVGYDGAVRLADTGWIEGTKRLLHASAALTGRGAPTLTEYDVAGDDVDVGRYVTGEPECMIRYAEDIRKGGKVITVAADICTAWHVKSDSYINRGAALLSLVDILESSGYRVELWVTFRSSGKVSGTRETRIIVKESDEHIDIDRLAYMICHPAYFRRISFRHYEILDSQLDQGHNYSLRAYGTCADSTMPCDIRSKALLEEMSITQARDWVQSQCVAYGVEFSWE